MLLAAATMIGCRATPETHGDVGFEADGGGEPSGSPTADGSPTTCGEVRACVHRCADSVCAERCLDAAGAATRKLYEDLAACSRQHCPTQEKDCRCEAECWGAGACFDLKEACVVNQADPFCDICH